MSLVDYGSSDESDGESSPAGPPPTLLRHGLWPPQAPAAKRGDPVRISAPRLQDSSDSDEEEPAQKRRHQGSGLGLTALLPQAKNLTVKETNRPLLPHVFTKRDKAAVKPSGGGSGGSKLPVTPTPTPSPSAIKAASKSAAKQLARHIMNEEPSEEEGDEEVSFFSLPDSRPQPLPLGPRTDTLPSERLPLAPGAGAEEPPELRDPLNPADAPLEFTRGAYAGGSHQGAVLGRQPAGPDYSGFPSPSSEQGQAYQDYFSDYNAAPAAAPEQEMQTFLNDEAFKRLQGKRNRGKEEVSFLEIKGDDQLSGSQQWLMKSITEEKDMKSFSKKRGDQPTSQQRRKHQITYLIHQAKERELELKNTWSDNRLTKRQTQAKYGF